MKNHSTAGFSLMEMAIVLIILGVVGSMAMPSVLRYRQQAAFTQTQQKQEDAFRAIASYALLKNRLPCPADPSAAGAENGKERRMCNSASSAIGILPYKTLGLSASAAKDGFGRWMTYAVPAYTVPTYEPGERSSVCRVAPSPGLELKVMNEHRQNVAGDLDDLNFVAAVLVSYGENGQGSHMNETVHRMTLVDASEAEKINTDNTRIFYDKPYSRNPDNPFRQSVRWVTVGNLMALYAGKPCTFEGAPHDQQNDGFEEHNPFH